jgi:hypothetical protein
MPVTNALRSICLLLPLSLGLVQTEKLSYFQEPQNAQTQAAKKTYQLIKSKKPAQLYFDISGYFSRCVKSHAKGQLKNIC